VIAPGDLALHHGAMCPEWEGSVLIAGLGSRSRIRITFGGRGGVAPAERWDLGRELRHVAVGRDGSVWLLVNDMPGGRYRLTLAK
jgi:glucose/arabinose dehydrogenase